MLYFHLGNFHAADAGDAARQVAQYERALELIARPLRHLKGRRVTFLCGDAGPLALGAVLYDRLGQTKERDKCVAR